jgi:hypothetical protein
MTTQLLDDWEGRLAAMSAGVRYRPARHRARPLRVPEERNDAELQNDSDSRPFLSEACPCDHCELRQQCAVKRLACARYALFMKGDSGTHWRTVPAEPTRERFNRILGATD